MRLMNITRMIGLLAIASAVAGCQVDGVGYGAKHLRPLKEITKAKMADLNMRKGDPIVVRIFKQESQLEVWKRTRNGRFALLKTYPICKWSGRLGPKFREGDRQAPEGFYTVNPAQMNPRSSYHLAFNMGFPNAYDRAHGRTGSHLMVHGACSSRGCYAMDDDKIEDIYALARESFRGGQRNFQIQAYPFRMTPENMARYAGHKHMPFWRMLKAGNDHFLLTGQPPKIDVCEKRYLFNAQMTNPTSPVRAAGRCPQYEVPLPIATAVAAKQASDNQAMAVAVARLKEEKRLAAERKREEAESKIASAKRERKRKEMLAKVFGGDDAVSKATVDGEPVPQPSPRRSGYANGKAPGSVFSTVSNIFSRTKKPAGPTPPADVAGPAKKKKKTATKPETTSKKAKKVEEAEAKDTSGGSLFSRWFKSSEKDAETSDDATPKAKPKS